MNAAQKVDVLAVCPFCGHDDIRRDRTSPNNIGPIVYCDQCGAEALSVDAWNMRTPSAAVAELIEAAAARLKEGAGQMTEAEHRLSAALANVGSAS
jgi:ribosomal protein L37AE/L43A